MSNPSAPDGPREPTAHPAHREADDTAGDQARGTNWATVLLLGLVGALVVAMLVLHLTGVVGPAGHR